VSIESVRAFLAEKAMPGGIDNPLGARALYLYRGNRDPFFRLHGTNVPTTIGQAITSGCIRLFNQDIIDLYDLVPFGAPVLVLQEETEPRHAAMTVWTNLD
jgi:lipoprotein-anchoring transpeptidase ErfK/SrfK